MSSTTFETLPQPVLSSIFEHAIDAWTRRSSAFGVTLQLLSRSLFEPARSATLRYAIFHGQRGVDELATRLTEDQEDAARVKFVGAAKMSRDHLVNSASLVKLLKLASNLVAVDLCLGARGLREMRKLGLGQMRLAGLWLKIVWADQDGAAAANELVEILVGLAPRLRALGVIVQIEEDFGEGMPDLKADSVIRFPRLVELHCGLPSLWRKAIVAGAPQLVELHVGATAELLSEMDDEAVSRITLIALANQSGAPNIFQPAGIPPAGQLARLTALVDLTLTNGRLSEIAAHNPRSVRRLTLRHGGDVEDILYALEDGDLPALAWFETDAAVEWNFLTMSGVADYSVRTPWRRSDEAVMKIWQRAALESYGQVEPVTEAELAGLSASHRYNIENIQRRGRQRVADEERRGRLGKDYRVDYRALLEEFHWSRGVLGAALDLRGIDHPSWRYRLVGLPTELHPFGPYCEPKTTLEPEL